MSNPFLSIIIPVHNEEKRLPLALEQTIAFLEAQTYQAEVIIVENGSSDRTLEIAREISDRNPLFKTLEEEKSGKGLAVRVGMLAASGEYRFFCDVDFSMPISEVNRFLPPNLVSIDVAIASREVPGAIRYNEPQYRHLTGRVFNALVRLIVLPGLHDTQCGFKCFRGEVADNVFRLQTLTGWSFDAEVLFIARRLGFKIHEVPIPWFYNPDSRVHLVKDSFQMTFDMVAIRQNARRGVYAP